MSFVSEMDDWQRETIPANAVCVNAVPVTLDLPCGSWHLSPCVLCTHPAPHCRPALQPRCPILLQPVGPHCAPALQPALQLPHCPEMWGGFIPE